VKSAVLSTRTHRNVRLRVRSPRAKLAMLNIPKIAANTTFVSSVTTIDVESNPLVQARGAHCELASKRIVTRGVTIAA